MPLWGIGVTKAKQQVDEVVKKLSSSKVEIQAGDRFVVSVPMLVPRFSPEAIRVVALVWDYPKEVPILYVAPHSQGAFAHNVLDTRTSTIVVPFDRSGTLLDHILRVRDSLTAVPPTPSPGWVERVLLWKPAKDGMGVTFEEPLRLKEVTAGKAADISGVRALLGRRLTHMGPPGSQLRPVKALDQVRDILSDQHCVILEFAPPDGAPSLYPAPPAAPAGNFIKIQQGVRYVPHTPDVTNPPPPGTVPQVEFPAGTTVRLLKGGPVWSDVTWAGQQGWVRAVDLKDGPLPRPAGPVFPREPVPDRSPDDAPMVLPSEPEVMAMLSRLTLEQLQGYDSAKMPISKLTESLGCALQCRRSIEELQFEIALAESGRDSLVLERQKLQKVIDNDEALLQEEEVQKNDQEKERKIIEAQISPEAVLRRMDEGIARREDEVRAITQGAALPLPDAVQQQYHRAELALAKARMVRKHFADSQLPPPPALP
eukprot:TRINITY_DN70469_c0_g1_i1.p1 TRINITY_DN70469_c0_g1~~TRINITY_DN70469_c0_g1_i1.p1  ORF type:complete len:483 (+),score=154.73 TRINITY_DN70469_c0_g1_i1:95-1543(+)